jgi:hypothetical protein
VRLDRYGRDLVVHEVLQSAVAPLEVGVERLQRLTMRVE